MTENSTEKFSQEEIAKMETSRTIETAKLLKEGAEFEVGKDGSITLKLLPEQIQKIDGEMKGEMIFEKKDKTELGKEILEQNDQQLFELLYDTSYNMWLLSHEDAHGRLDKKASESLDEYLATEKVLYYTIATILKKRNNWGDEKFKEELHLQFERIRNE
jgi:hypothetical protein